MSSSATPSVQSARTARNNSSCFLSLVSGLSPYFLHSLQRPSWLLLVDANIGSPRTGYREHRVPKVHGRFFCILPIEYWRGHLTLNGAARVALLYLSSNQFYLREATLGWPSATSTFVSSPTAAEKLTFGALSVRTADK
jgi:hypothetical protein